MCDNIQKQTFVDCVLSGQALVTDIDDFVDQWAESKKDGSLAAFLGLTDAEYALWVEHPESLPRILSSKEAIAPRSQSSS